MINKREPASVKMNLRRCVFALLALIAVGQFLLFFVDQLLTARAQLIMARSKEDYDCDKDGNGYDLLHNNKMPMQSNSTSKRYSLLHMVAPSYFPIDPNTGKIAFPKEVETVIIDVGAREPSHFLNMVTKLKDPKIALIMFDPLYDSYVPIAKRALEYDMQDTDPLGDFVLSEVTRRVFAVNAAIGPTEQQVAFQMSASAHCGSILPEALLDVPPEDATGCPHKIGTAQAMVFTLQDVLALIPRRSGIKSLHVKVDAEGADFSILESAGKALKRATTVIFECRAGRITSAVCEDLGNKLMCEKAGMCAFSRVKDNGIYWRKDKDSSLSLILDGYMKPPKVEGYLKEVLHEDLAVLYKMVK